MLPPCPIPALLCHGCRFQGLSFREKVWLLQAAPTLVVERASMHDLAEGLRCLAQHQQRSKLRKLVCLATRLPDRLGEFLDDLRVGATPMAVRSKAVTVVADQWYRLSLLLLLGGRRARTCAACA